MRVVRRTTCHLALFENKTLIFRSLVVHLLVYNFLVWITDGGCVYDRDIGMPGR